MYLSLQSFYSTVKRIFDKSSVIEGTSFSLLPFSFLSRDAEKIMQYPRDFVATKISVECELDGTGSGCYFCRPESSAKRDGFDLILANLDAAARTRAPAPSTLIPG